MSRRPPSPPTGGRDAPLSGSGLGEGGGGRGGGGHRPEWWERRKRGMDRIGRGGDPAPKRTGAGSSSSSSSSGAASAAGPSPFSFPSSGDFPAAASQPAPAAATKAPTPPRVAFDLSQPLPGSRAAVPAPPAGAAAAPGAAASDDPDASTVVTAGTDPSTSSSSTSSSGISTLTGTQAWWAAAAATTTTTGPSALPAAAPPTASAVPPGWQSPPPALPPPQLPPLLPPAVTGAAAPAFPGFAGAAPMSAQVPPPLPPPAPVPQETPKTALHRVYGQLRRKVLSAQDYFTWNDGGPPHALKWTSVFLCPSTGEVFASARYGPEAQYVVRDGVAWFGKKTMAEHGAACRALDCLRLREASSPGSVATAVPRMGPDQPYLAPSFAVPPHAPAKQRMDIEHQQSQILQIPSSAAGMPGPTAPGAGGVFDDQRVKSQLQEMKLSSSPPRQMPPARGGPARAGGGKALHDDIFGDD